MVVDEGEAAVDVLQVPEWRSYGWLRHGFSTRSGGCSTLYSGGAAGDLNLGFTKDDDPEAVAENRRRLLRSVGGEADFRLVAVRQVHGTKVLRVRADETHWAGAGGRGLVEADGLMTDEPGIMLAAQAADCVPVLVVDLKRRAVAAFHAGWRGTVAGIVEQGIARFAEEFGGSPADMAGAVGPSIGGCCYTVGEEVRGQFGARFRYAEELFQQRENGLHLDLAEANRRQMLAAGLSARRVTVLGECTACARVGGRRKFFSHRSEAGFTGRGMGVVGIVF